FQRSAKVLFQLLLPSDFSAPQRCCFNCCCPLISRIIIDVEIRGQRQPLRFSTNTFTPLERICGSSLRSTPHRYSAGASSWSLIRRNTPPYIPCDNDSR